MEENADSRLLRKDVALLPIYTASCLKADSRLLRKDVARLPIYTASYLKTRNFEVFSLLSYVNVRKISNIAVTL